MVEFKLMAAPLQGYTEAPFRHFHAEIYGAESYGLTYFSPFLRLEKGVVRPRDIRDVTSDLNSNHRLIPQLICRDADEFRLLTGTLVGAGYNMIDLNMGCPFVPQVKKGRGAGLLLHPDKVGEIAYAMSEFSDIGSSLKMRLGVSDSDEWRKVIPIINTMKLTHVTVHPRTASQQYSGELHLAEFEKLAAEIEHPLVFNGDITLPDMISALQQKFPTLAGVMIGRGMLMRPSIFAEWAESRVWNRAERVEKLIRLHDCIFDHYCNVLSGETQILSKIKPLWDYFGAEFDRKAVKAISKSTKLSKYTAAIRNLT